MIERLRRDDKSPLLSIASEWRVLFRPAKTGCYVNDHSIIRSADGKWHLIGITSHDPDPEQERYFAHGSGPLLWSDTPMEEHNPVCNDGVRAWTPAVIAREHKYYMLYGPSPTKLAISRDLSHWMGAVPSLVGAPPEACHRDHMILSLEPSTWLLYASGIDAHGLGMISLFVSNDLINWRFIRAALRTEGRCALRCAWELQNRLSYFSTKAGSIFPSLTPIAARKTIAIPCYSVPPILSILEPTMQTIRKVRSFNESRRTHRNTSAMAMNGISLPAGGRGSQFLIKALFPSPGWNGKKPKEGDLACTSLRSNRRLLHSLWARA